MATEFHLTLGPGFTGDVRMSDDGRGFTVRSLVDDGKLAADGVDDDRIAAIVDRYVKHTPEAQDIYAGLVGQGWKALAPKPTKQDTNNEYLRFSYVGSVERVALYFNTRNITCASTAVRAFAASLPTADRRSNDNVCFYYDGSHDGSVETALAAAAKLIEFADGAVRQ